ncbi:unnamed protein product, partial [Prorocentrum cordatum]
ELESLLRSLARGSAALPTPRQLDAFRRALAGRLLWVVQARRLAAEADGGAQLLREAYERQLLVDPENLTVADGTWVQAAWFGGGQVSQEDVRAAQAMLRAVSVIVFDGRTTSVSVDPATASVHQVMDIAAQQVGTAFDPARHAVFAVGVEPSGPQLTTGHFVRITGLVEGEDLNGQVGQILCQDDDVYTVALPSGARNIHRDNVVHHSAQVVHRSRGTRAAPAAALAALGPGPLPLRLLWLEARPPRAAPAAAPASGPLAPVRQQLLGMDVDGDGLVSAGELRSHLWRICTLMTSGSRPFGGTSVRSRKGPARTTPTRMPLCTCSAARTFARGTSQWTLSSTRRSCPSWGEGPRPTST